MPMTKLFGNRIPPACRHCELAMRYIQGEDMVLCEKKGVVKPDYSCKYYRYDPLKRDPKRLASREKHEEADFSL